MECTRETARRTIAFRSIVCGLACGRQRPYDAIHPSEMPRDAVGYGPTDAGLDTNRSRGTRRSRTTIVCRSRYAPVHRPTAIDPRVSDSGCVSTARCRCKYFNTNLPVYVFRPKRCSVISRASKCIALNEITERHPCAYHASTAGFLAEAQRSRDKENFNIHRRPSANTPLPTPYSFVRDVDRLLLIARRIEVFVCCHR